MLVIQVGCNFEHLAGQVTAPTDAGGAKRHFGIVLPGLLQIIFKCFDVAGRIHHQHIAENHTQRQCRCINHGVIVQFVQMLIDRQRTYRAQHDGVAIRRRLGEQVSGDVATRTRFVVNHHSLLEQLCELGHHDARHRIGASAR